MKLLVLSSRPPWPPTLADQMTVDRLMRFLAQRGHAVDLLCFVESESQDRELRDGLGLVCREIETVRLTRRRSYVSTAATLLGRKPMQVEYFRSKAMQRAVERRARDGDYDLVYTHLIRMAEYTRHLPVRKVIGFQISQALNLERMVFHARDPFRRVFYGIEKAKVQRYEARVCADYDRVLLCGVADLNAIERRGPVPNAVICPHGQDIPPPERVRDADRKPGSIVISGVMRTYTNVDAVRWFAKEMFPRIEREVPGAVLWIVGRQPQPTVRELARPPRVIVTGEVPDVADWLCRAEVGVAPLRIAAGMQNKLLQAMACGLPVVATSVANEGICAIPGEHLLVRDDANSIAEGVISLLKHASARARLGAAARRFVETHWTWDARFEKFENVLRQFVA